ncbi:DUF5131 family protein [Candidatus Entotheonella palauensis]|uniref:DUF5131 family protein n=1 Tax=Candidatus Entotheonella palauensis TaxID=93172 RepID=UPI000B7D86B0
MTWYFFLITEASHVCGSGQDFSTGSSVKNSHTGFRDSLPSLILSCEPLLGPILDLPLSGIGWVMVGGESGRCHHRHPPFARPSPWPASRAAPERHGVTEAGY